MFFSVCHRCMDGSLYQKICEIAFPAEVFFGIGIVFGILDLIFRNIFYDSGIQDQPFERFRKE